MALITDRNLTADFRGALIEAKEAMEGKRKLNTLDRLIVELQEDSSAQRNRPYCALIYVR